MAALAALVIAGAGAFPLQAAGGQEPALIPEGSGVIEFGSTPAVSSGDVAPVVADKLAHATRSRFVEIDAGEVAAAVRTPEVALELFADVATPLHDTAGLLAGTGGSRTWSGVDGDGDYATLSFIDGQILGNAAIDGALYDIQPVSGGTHLITEEGRESLPLGEPLRPPGPEGESGLPATAAESDSGTDPVIRVLNVYDTAARDYYGSDAAAQSQLAAAVNEANATYDRSGVHLTLESVGNQYVDYTAGADGESELYRLRGTTDGYLDGVHAERDRLGADLVSLMSGSVTSVCGIAWLGGGESYAFSVVRAQCGRLTYTHELGHNQGAGHGPPDGDGLFPYSNGYRDVVNGFRTVMAYNSASCPAGYCAWLGYFSGPTVLYDGHPIGDAAHDNARTLNETAAAIAAYRGLPTSEDLTDPTIDIRTPAEGAQYVRLQGVMADYACTDPPPSAGLIECTATLGFGSYLDTRELGLHTFTVTARDRAGRTTIATRQYIVVKPPRPDLRIGVTGSRPMGNNIYNTTGTGQSTWVFGGTGATFTHVVSAQNDGSTSQRLRIKGSATSGGVTVRYRTGGVDITAQVVAGTYLTRNLAPHATQDITVIATLRSSARANVGLARYVTASSTLDNSRKDRVGVTYTRY